MVAVPGRRMAVRGNEYDVTARVKTTDPSDVEREVERLYGALYPGAPTDQLQRAFSDVVRLYRGEYPGYHACDTSYHNLQHVLDVTLAMARLLDGYERGPYGSPRFGDRVFRLGIICALLHDCGYIRELGDEQHKNGAEYTLTHVSRGSVFIRKYLPRIGMVDLAGLAAKLIHFTGYEHPIASIEISSPLLRLLGSLLGSADIIAQMADRCYLEKCRDRLYPEFVAGGIARRHTAAGTEIVYESGPDVVMKTPRFMEDAMKRLEVDLGGAHRYAETHFGGSHLYLHEARKNVAFARKIRDTGNLTLLRRNLP